MENLTAETFRKKVFNYEKNNEWKFEGKKPAIVDFWADWCQPCKTLGPILEELSKEYKEKIDFYKIDIEDQHELATTFGIKSIPTLLFIPINDKPQMSVGSLDKDDLKKAFTKVFNING